MEVGFSLEAGGFAALGGRANLEDGWCIVRTGRVLVASVVDLDGASDSAVPETRAAVEAIRRASEADVSPAELPAVVSAAVSAAIRESLSRRGWRGSWAALALVAVADREAFVGWVGHCRVYRIRAGHLEALTADHTLAAPRSDHDERSFRFVALRTLGEADDPPSVRRVDLAPGDRLVLATDGVWAPLGGPGVLGTAVGSPTDAAKRLVEAAHAVDDSDNAAAVVVEARAG